MAMSTETLKKDAADPLQRQPSLSTSGSGSFRDRLLSHGPSLNDVCFDVASLQQLARQGSWRALVGKVHRARRLRLLQYPHERLAYHAYLVLAFIKLRDYSAAAEELGALKDLDSPEYRFERYPDAYPGRRGSLVPFLLRWLRAELPHRLGQTQESVERLYLLLSLCQRRIHSLATNNSVDSEGTATRMAPNLAPNALQQGFSSITESPPVPVVPSVEFNGVEIPQTREGSNEPEQSISLNTEQNLVPKLTDMAVSSVDLDGVEIAHGDPDSMGNPEGSNEPEQGIMSSDTEHNVAEIGDRLGQSLRVSDPSSVSELEFGDFVSSLAGPAGIEAARKRWQSRYEFVVCSLVALHVSEKDFAVAIKLLKGLLDGNPENRVELLSKLGYAQMQMGDLESAKATFAKVEAEAGPELLGLVHRNKGLLHVVSKQYAAAAEEFDAAVRIDPSDVVSVNNKALCLMFMTDLVGAMKVLESMLDKEPAVALNEKLVLNLCSMYELAYVNNTETKKKLRTWIEQARPEDFDLTCTRL